MRKDGEGTLLRVLVGGGRLTCVIYLLYTSTIVCFAFALVLQHGVRLTNGFEFFCGNRGFVWVLVLSHQKKNNYSECNEVHTSVQGMGGRGGEVGSVASFGREGLTGCHLTACDRNDGNEKSKVGGLVRP